ncbi:uncharacterized protein LOC103100280 isoform X2 [Monodelphis domestica]|uniref:uncharacterized protein LOC103100280 isoform X2 n=1 Tax=Monodelphis domestica TaxID=13616 RepID=UPI0024E1E9A1|nr:uncharacterized protein LOC103100280 isoform X2 [Monodelphis domestica]
MVTATTMTAATFHISMDPSPVLVSPGSDVLLQCIFPVVGEDTPIPTVAWHHGQQLLAEYDGILVTQRPGTELPESAEGLRKGNASLLLHRVAMADLGSYYCTVTIGEQQAEAEVLLEISAAPHISLLPVQDFLGEKTTLLCQIKGFYPAGGLQAWWLRNGEKVPEATPVGSPRLNPDGTFDLELILNLTLKSDDLADNFTCHVTHPALEHPLQEKLEMEVKKEKWWKDVQSNNRPSVSSILIIILGITVLVFAIIYQFRRNRGQEEQEEGEVRTAADGKEREQPQEKSDFQSSGRNWEAEKLLPKDHTESEEEILQGEIKVGFLQGYRKTEGVMEMRYGRTEREIIVDCRETEDKILILKGDREGQVLLETGESKGQNLRCGESEGRVLKEVEVDTEGQFQEADGLRTEGQILKGNRQTEDYKRDKEATEGQVQGGEAEEQTQGRDAEKQTQGEDSEKEVQGRDAEGQAQGEEAEGEAQGGEAEEQTQGEEAEGEAQGGEVEGQAQGKEAEGEAQGGEAEGQAQGGEAEGEAQGGEAEGQAQGGEAEGQAEGSDAEGQAQGEEAEGQAQGEEAEGQAQGGEAEGQAQGGEAEGQAQGGEAEGQAQGGEAEGQAQGGEAEGQAQGEEAEGQAQGEEAEGQAQGRDAEGEVRGGDAEGQVQGEEAEEQFHRGNEEITERYVSKDIGANGMRSVRGEGETMEQIPSGCEGIEGLASSEKADTQSLRINEDLSEQSPGAVGDRGSSPKRRHGPAPGIDGEVRGKEK